MLGPRLGGHSQLLLSSSRPASAARTSGRDAAEVEIALREWDLDSGVYESMVDCECQITGQDLMILISPGAKRNPGYCRQSP